MDHQPGIRRLSSTTLLNESKRWRGTKISNVGGPFKGAGQVLRVRYDLVVWAYDVQGSVGVKAQLLC